MIEAKPASPLLVYVACPSRMASRADEFQNVVVEGGHAPLNPFLAFPYPLFEGGPPGRERTLEWCCRLIDICDEVWLFGISAGTLFEVQHLLSRGRRKDLRDFTDVYDDEVETRRFELEQLIAQA
ncbi:hypothetical protein G5C51_16690 [Streptomyces sp. A7024]|uniref:DUF7768 domain-containing protein n=1 Tax=Streptomyces coryli TaxID=1128680 RepID=A0A6G4U2C9_9ACTN|nr:hypothetical protein [Streptomyces coryli]NGN65528.1 hypothetical protein [Streptomyces coryli]